MLASFARAENGQILAFWFKIADILIMIRQGGGPTILVAEDEDLSRKLLCEILSGAGFAVVPTENGTEALAAMRERRVDLAIVDQVMDPVCGLEFAQILREEGVRIPVIMVTAHDVSDLLVQAWRSGIGSVLKKPVEATRLLDAVERALRWQK